MAHLKCELLDTCLNIYDIVEYCISLTHRLALFIHTYQSSAFVRNVVRLALALCVHCYIYINIRTKVVAMIKSQGSKLASNEFNFDSELSDYELVVSLNVDLKYDVDKCGYSLDVYGQDVNGEWTRLDVSKMNADERADLDRKAQLHFEKVLGELHAEFVESAPAHRLAPRLFAKVY